MTPRSASARICATAVSGRADDEAARTELVPLAPQRVRAREHVALAPLHVGRILGSQIPASRARAPPRRSGRRTPRASEGARPARSRARPGRARAGARPRPPSCGGSRTTCRQAGPPGGQPRRCSRPSRWAASGAGAVAGPGAPLPAGSRGRLAVTSSPSSSRRDDVELLPVDAAPRSAGSPKAAFSSSR